MGRFSKLLQNTGKEFVIGEEKFMIKPLTGKHLGLFMNVKESEKDKASMNMILVTLQQTDKTITLEDIGELPFGTITKLMEVITEVNELDK